MQRCQAFHGSSSSDVRFSNLSFSFQIILIFFICIDFEVLSIDWMISTV